VRRAAPSGSVIWNDDLCCARTRLAGVRATQG
jgi:hypothetical protein